MTDHKTYILDPLTCLCKLALLNFLPVDTRVSIHKHVLYIQEPSILLGATRRFNCDARGDLANLNTPLYRAIKWYLLDEELDTSIKEHIRIITEYAIEGIKKMQKYTYHNSSDIGITLQYFINLLRNALTDKWNEEEVFHTEIDSHPLLDRIKNNYDENFIVSIVNTLNDASSSVTLKGRLDAHTQCCLKLLSTRDEDFVRMMVEINTTL